MKNRQKNQGENYFSTGLVDLFMWISASESENSWNERVSYGFSWLKGQVRLGVLSWDQYRKAYSKLNELRVAGYGGKPFF